MTGITVGDQAQYQMLSRFTAKLNATLNEGVKELGSEEESDVSNHLSGNFSSLAGVEKDLVLNDSYSLVLTSAKSFLDGQSLAFDKARSYSHSTGLGLIDASNSSSETYRESVLAESRSAFESVVAALNSQSSGKFLFSGASTQVTPFAAPNEILTAFSVSVSGATTAGDVLTMAETWFDSGGDYDTVAYFGSTDPIGEFLIGDSESIAPVLRGESDEIRDLLKLHAISSVLSDGAISLIESEKTLLMEMVGEQLIQLDEELVVSAASLGSLESRVEEAQVRNESERFSLSEARTSLIGVDTADTYLKVSEAEGRLQMLYSVTARLSGLSLVSFL